VYYDRINCVSAVPSARGNFCSRV